MTATATAITDPPTDQVVSLAETITDTLKEPLSGYAAVMDEGVAVRRSTVHRMSATVRFGVKKMQVYLGMDRQIWRIVSREDINREGLHRSPGQVTICDEPEAAQWLIDHCPPSPDRDRMLWYLAQFNTGLYYSLLGSIQKHGKIV